MSSQEVQALILKRIDELRDEQRETRQLMSKEHNALGEKFDGLSTRVQKLEHDNKITRWVFSAWGVLFGFLIREVVRRIWL